MEESESSTLNNSKTSTMVTFGVIAVLLLGVVGGMVFMSNRSQPAKSEIASSPSVSAGVNVASPVAADENTVVVNMTGANFKFDPAEITVKKGQTIKVVLTSKDMPHDFVIDDLKVRSGKATINQGTDVTFVADKVGEFEYYCSVGNHRQMGMVGKLIVTE